MMESQSAGKGSFKLEEATIDDVQAGIRAGRITCVDIVDYYIERVKAYNGVASLLVTEDGQSIAESSGSVRVGQRLRFPMETVRASNVLPDLDHYVGPPLEFGRMEATASDPAVEQQFGMIAGMKGGSQVNALATLNIRGERSGEMHERMIWQRTTLVSGKTL